MPKTETPTKQYVCRYPFQITPDLKPLAGRNPDDIKWLHFAVGDTVPERIVKASPSLLDELPGRGFQVRKVEV